MPTASESGLLGPAGLPKPILDKLQGAIAAMFRNPDKPLFDQFTALGIVPTRLHTPEQFGEYLKSDFAFWKKLVTDTAVKVN